MDNKNYIRKSQASFRVFEIRDGIEFPIIDESLFTKQDKEETIIDLQRLINRLAKHWNINLEEFIEKQRKIWDLEMRIDKKIKEKQEKDLKEFEEWKAKKLKRTKKRT